MPICKVLPRRSKLSCLFSAAVLFASAAIVQPAIAQTPASHKAPPLTGTAWRLADFPGHAVEGEGYLRPEIILSAEGSRIVGFAGCNRFLGTYVQQGQSLNVSGNLATGRRRCKGGMDFESDFLRMLQSADEWQIKGGQLELLKEKQRLATFKVNVPPPPGAVAAPAAAPPAPAADAAPKP